MREERVHHRDICDGDAPREDYEDVPSSLDVASGAICCGARTGCKARETTKCPPGGGELSTHLLRLTSLVPPGCCSRCHVRPVEEMRGKRGAPRRHLRWRCPAGEP
jgi:hypothetical protein